MADHLTDEERGRLARSSSSDLLKVARLFAAQPKLAGYASRVALRGSIHAVRADPTLGWLANMHHVRSVAPNAVFGAEWGAYETFVEAFRLAAKPTGSGLEIGCGGGRVTQHLRPLVANLDAVDVSAAILAEARNQVSDTRFFVVEGFGANLPSDRYDVVASHDVFVHFEYDECAHYFANIARSLRSAGKFVFSVFTLDNDAEIEGYREEISQHADLNARRVRRFPSTVYEGLLAVFGFDVVDRVRVPSEEYGFNRPDAHLVIIAQRTNTGTSLPS